MTSRLFTCLFIAIGTLLMATSGLAILVDRGGGLIYDSDSDITWLQDANHARTLGYDPDGRMTWEVAMSFAANLDYYDPVRDTTWSDWRLPDALNPDGSGPCFGFDCPDSEHGHLCIVDGIRVFIPGIFANFGPGSYWSNTRRAPLPGNAWLFNFTICKLDHTGPLEDLVVAFAHVVRDGDVVEPPPTVPGLGPTGLLLLSALLVFAIYLRGRPSSRRAAEGHATS